MNPKQVPALGEEFAAIASGVCGISPFMAKLILYNTLDDGYGRYFNDIFDAEDRENPYLVREIGSPIPRRLNGVSKRCVEQARECIAARNLKAGEWHKSWKDVALCDGVSRTLKNYGPGELGQKFLSTLGSELSLVDTLIAKRALEDFVACNAATDKIYTDYERGANLYYLLRQWEDWHPGDLCSAETYAQMTKAAYAFAASELHMFEDGAPFVGVTFGWPTPDRKEWHLYGDLVRANVLRCKLSDLPRFFGMACYTAPKTLLQRMYESTYLCVVAVDAVKRSVPDIVSGAYVYDFPVNDLVSCKWVGTLAELLGPYPRYRAQILSGYNSMKKEGA